MSDCRLRVTESLFELPAGQSPHRERRRVREVKSMILPRRIFLLLAVAVASVSATRAQPERGKVRVALKGYDAVAYFTLGRPEKGDPNISFDWDGGRYHFISQHHRDQFVADPERYAPQFGAHCTASLSRGEKVEADPEQWLISDGRLYLFASAGGPGRMKRDGSMAARARENWRRQR